MSSSIITVCTRIHTVIRNIHTYIHTYTYARAQMTSFTDLPEIHYIEGGSEDNGRHRTEEVNVFVGAGDDDRQDTKKKKK